MKKLGGSNLFFVFLDETLLESPVSKVFPTFHLS